MTSAHFYILTKDASPQGAYRLACRLAEKAFLQQLRVYIQVASPEVSLELDELLWSFRDSSFVPHGVGDDSPICISHAVHEPEGRYDVLINLSFQLPSFHGQFDRIVEIVTADTSIRQQARERYALYRQLGYPLQTHEV